MNPLDNTAAELHSEKLVVICAPRARTIELAPVYEGDNFRALGVTKRFAYDLEALTALCQRLGNGELRNDEGIPFHLTNLIIYHDDAYTSPEAQIALARAIQKLKEHRCCDRELDVTVVYGTTEDKAAAVAAYHDLNNSLPDAGCDVLTNFSYPEEDYIARRIGDVIAHAYNSQRIYICAPRVRQSALNHWLRNNIGAGLDPIMLSNIEAFDQIYYNAENNVAPEVLIVAGDWDPANQQQLIDAIITDHAIWGQSHVLVIPPETPDAPESALVKVSDFYSRPAQQLREFVAVEDVAMAGLRRSLLIALNKDRPDFGGSAIVPALPRSPFRGGGAAQSWPKL